MEIICIFVLSYKLLQMSKRKIETPDVNIMGEIARKEQAMTILLSQKEKIESDIAKCQTDLLLLKKKNAETIVIRWKESVKWCLETDATNPYYFIKTPLFVAMCIAKKHGVEITRDIKNKISTTLSIMFNQKEIGRTQHNGASYYGLPEFFKKDLMELKDEYQDKIDLLRQ